MTTAKMLYLGTVLIASFTAQFCTAQAIVIHGGAGVITREGLSPEQEKAYRIKLKQAVDSGYDVLAAGGSSLDAVSASIQIMENSALFNAGKGAVYNYAGQHDLDSSIMDGSTKMAGAVAGVKIVKNPIKLARAVMEKSPHVLLAGSGAEAFAKTQDIELVPNSYFDTKRRLESLQRAKQKLKLSSWNEVDKDLSIDYKMGTVGAVAVDKNGNIAAGTSTGGRTAKRYGRVGDSPLIGAGTWADNSSCGVSATGHGEFFIRYNVAADICARVKYKGLSIQQAADEVIQKELVDVKGSGGVIVLNANGEIAYSFNTEGMYRAQRSEGKPAQIDIFGQAEKITN